MIVEGEIAFDFEITQLTVRAKDGTHFCEPIGHVQKDGDYVEMLAAAADERRGLARKPATWRPP